MTTVITENISSLAGGIEATDEGDEESARKTLRLIFSVAYFVLFLVGTVGNGYVIIMIVNVMTAIRRTSYRGNLRRPSCSSTKHVFIYVLGLSIVDFLVIIHLPFLIADLLYGQWLFGEAMCKLYWFGECVNKLLSSFIMTILSWDRYLAVCSPINSFKIRSNTVACTVLIMCSALATLLLLPVLVNATVVHLNILSGQTFQLSDEDSDLLLHSGTTVTKCMFDGTNSFFVFYTFVCGFLLPALLITFFYSMVILRLQKSAENIRKHNLRSKQFQSNSRVQQVTKRIVAVILFYFFCWTPQWTLNLLSHFSLITVSWSTLTLSSIFFAAHLLVCFNSAANPVLYALINRELRQQHVQAMIKRRRSVSTATNVALDFIGRHSHSFRLAGFAAPLRHKSHSFDVNSQTGGNKRTNMTLTTSASFSQMRSEFSNGGHLLQPRLLDATGANFLRIGEPRTVEDASTVRCRPSRQRVRKSTPTDQLRSCNGAFSDDSLSTPIAPAIEITFETSDFLL